MKPRKFSVQLSGGFFTFDLISEDGKYVYTLSEAIKAAEFQHGKDGWIVYNGEVAEDRIA